MGWRVGLAAKYKEVRNMAGIEGVTTQMAGIIPLTAISGLSVNMAKSVFDNPMTPSRRKRTIRRTSRHKSRRNALGGTAPF